MLINTFKGELLTLNSQVSTCEGILPAFATPVGNCPACGQALTEKVWNYSEPGFNDRLWAVVEGCKCSPGTETSDELV